MKSEIQNAKITTLEEIDRVVKIRGGMNAE